MDLGLESDLNSNRFGTGIRLKHQLAIESGCDRNWGENGTGLELDLELESEVD